MCLSPGVSLSSPLEWTHSGPQGKSICDMSTSKWHSSLSNTCSLIKLLTEAGHTQISFRQALRSNQHCRLRGQISLPPAQSPRKGGKWGSTTAPIPAELESVQLLDANGSPVSSSDLSLSIWRGVLFSFICPIRPPTCMFPGPLNFSVKTSLATSPAAHDRKVPRVCALFYFSSAQVQCHFAPHQNPVGDTR